MENQFKMDRKGETRYHPNSRHTESAISFSAVKDQRHNYPVAGYGRCRSCKCPGYRPNSPKNDYCKDCGHHWEMHY